jgi:AcrR family transcriptional regulator
VPRNRADVDRADKVDDIVGAARRQLETKGFAGFSIAAIARELGRAQNAVYWYFPTKDHLLIAAVEQSLHDVLVRKPRGRDPVEQIVWFTDQLAGFQGLRLSVRERARHDDEVARFDRDVTDLLRTLLDGLLSASVPPARRGWVVTAVLALCEGVLLADLPPRGRRGVLTEALPLLIG